MDAQTLVAALLENTNEGVPPEVLAGEAEALKSDHDLYLECLNGVPLKDRHTPEDIRQGLVLYWNVYRHIKPLPEKRPVRRRSRQEESKHGPTMKSLKKGKVKLTDEERAAVMKAGAVWHFSHQDKPTPAVWKSVVNGKTWYCCNTHRAGVCKPTLKGAIKAFKWVETTS